MTEASSSTSRRQCRSCQPAQRAPHASRFHGTWHPPPPATFPGPWQQGHGGQRQPPGPLQRPPLLRRRGPPAHAPADSFTFGTSLAAGICATSTPALARFLAIPPAVHAVHAPASAREEGKKKLYHPSIHPSNPTGQTTTLCFCVIAKPHTLLVSIPRKQHIPKAAVR